MTGKLGEVVKESKSTPGTYEAPSSLCPPQKNRSTWSLLQISLQIPSESPILPILPPTPFDTPSSGTSPDNSVNSSPMSQNATDNMWSLGCTLYALAYSRSLFEMTQMTEQGGSIAVAEQN
jgi:hypothetical protein